MTGTGFSILTMWSDPGAIISASTLDKLNDFVDEWLSNTSCVANSPMRSAAAYGVFAAKLAAENDYDEMRTLYDFARKAMP